MISIETIGALLPMIRKIPKGDDGDAATIDVGTVEYGDELSIVNSGTTSAAVFDFVIPVVHAEDDGAGNVTLY